MSSTPISATLNSAANRSELSSLFSSLRRVRPRVPFYQLAAHRIPTLWSLYRGLLREAPSDTLLWKVQAVFRKNHHLTSAYDTRTKLEMGYKWLNYFLAANDGDKKRQAVLARFGRMVDWKRKKEYWDNLATREMKWIQRLRSRAIMTGGYMRPTAFNRPLPRLKPQPIHITMMIKSRRDARDRRMERFELYRGYQNDLILEAEFEGELARLHPKKVAQVYRQPGWVNSVNDMLRFIQDGFNLEVARENTKFSPEMVETIKEARREKIRNKTRERERERRGEILKSTLKRMRQRPPAHVLDLMTPKQRRLDQVVRRASVGGWTGLMKKRMGFKLPPGAIFDV